MSDPRFARIELYLGEEACRRLRESFVVVAGLGAVGSYAVEGLVRAGVGKLRIADFDEIRESNINRQLFALTSTLGTLKVQAARSRILDINPACELDVRETFVDEASAADLLSGSPALLIDAIDSVTPKSQLLAAALTLGVPVISSMGAALRSDPSKVRTGPLSAVKGCPLARHIKKRLRNRGLPIELSCVYSEEQVPSPLPAVEGEEPFYDRGRRRKTLGSLPTVTGIFGLTAANLALQFLIGKARLGNGSADRG